MPARPWSDSENLNRTTQHVLKTRESESLKKSFEEHLSACQSGQKDVWREGHHYSQNNPPGNDVLTHFTSHKLQNEGITI